MICHPPGFCRVFCFVALLIQGWCVQDCQAIHHSVVQKIVVSPDGYTRRVVIEGESDGTESIYYRNFDVITDIQVTYWSEGNKPKKVKKKDIFIGNAWTSSFYSDVKKMDIRIPEKHKFKMTYQINCDDYVFLSSLEFPKEENAKKTAYHITIHPELSFDYNIDTASGIKVEQTHPIKIYNTKPLNKSETARIFVYPKGVDKEVFFSKWYLNHLEKKQKLSADHIAFLDTFCSGLSKEDRMDHLFQWTQTNIRYISYEDGYGAIIPRAASTVFTNRYGDCKDMAFFLHTSLRHWSIPSNIAISASTSYRFDMDFISLSSGNHCICIVPNGDDYYYLDATDEVVPFGDPSMHTQGKHIFVIDTLNPQQHLVKPIANEINREDFLLTIDPVQKVIHYEIKLRGKARELALLYTFDENKDLNSQFSELIGSRLNWDGTINLNSIDEDSVLILTGLLPLKYQLISANTNTYLPLIFFDIFSVNEDQLDDLSFFSYYLKDIHLSLTIKDKKLQIKKTADYKNGKTFFKQSINGQNTINFQFQNQYLLTHTQQEADHYIHLNSYLSDLFKKSIKILD